MTIFHLLQRSEWKRVQQSKIYRPTSLETEGFIHCSPANRVNEVAEAYFTGETDLVLLEIDPDRLASRLVYEAASDRAGSFPHIYGPLNLDAVVGVATFPPRNDAPPD